MRKVGKRFPGVRALHNIDLDLFSGEVLALVGENGAGKSTLMRILSGSERPDEGKLLLDSAEVELFTPGEALGRGIAMIHQELNGVDNLSVAENLFLGREPAWAGWIRRRSLVSQSQIYLARVGLDVNPAVPLGSLSIAQKQLVEIAKALSTRANVLIMDEPTSSLSQTETNRLMTLIDELRSDEVSVIYITHRLAEVMRIADRVEVLRDGRNAGTLVAAAITHDAMVCRMVGRDPQPLAKPPRGPGQRVRLHVRGLRVEGVGGILFPPLNLQAHSGEIVVLAGLIGAGRSETLETIFGVRRSVGGEVQVDAKVLCQHHVRDAINAGLAMVTEDRKATGLLVDSSVRVNATLATLDRAPANPWIRPSWERDQTATQVTSLGIKTATQQTVVATLSGGNQQKIAIAKWLIERPKVLLLDEPTRGVDIAARHEIYSILLRLVADGVAILMASSDMEEVITIADRVLVMHDGRIQGELLGDHITEQNILRLAVGE